MFVAFMVFPETLPTVRLPILDETFESSGASFKYNTKPVEVDFSLPLILLLLISPIVISLTFAP